MNIIFIIFKDRDLLSIKWGACVQGSEIVEWPESRDHVLCWLQKEFGFVLLFSLRCIFESRFELAPVLWVSLSNVALKMCCLLVFTRAEHVGTFVQVFAFVSELMRDQLDMIPELLVASGASQVALGYAFEPVLAIL